MAIVKLLRPTAILFGRTIPTFTYGFSLNVAYANFDANIDFNGVYGNDIINAKKLPTYAQFNFYTTSLNRWHGEGTSTVEPALNTAQGHNFESSTNLLESGCLLASALGAVRL